MARPYLRRLSRHALRACQGIALATCLMTGPASAEYLLVPDAHVVQPGSRIEVTLFLPNDAAEPRTVELPTMITLRARSLPGAPDVILTPTGSRKDLVTIAAGGFHRERYAGTLPDGLSGNLVLELVEYEGPPLAIAVVDPNAPVVAPKEPAPLPVEGKRDDVAAQAAGPSTPDTARFVSAFSPYEPNYFSGGSSGVTNAKFQISLKFRLFNPNTKTPFLEKLYVAYSQTSIWELGSSSKPFYDSSYRPSAFFLDEDVQQWPFRKWSRLGFQAGVEHESNGKSDEDSRSVNIAYIKPIFTLPLWENYFVSFAPKLYTYTEKDDNPDIPEYRGYGDYLIKIGAVDGLQLATTLRKGTAKDPYSAEFNLSYPLKGPTFGNLGGYLHLQYFEGYGESLLDYNQHVRPQFRIGLMITR